MTAARRFYRLQLAVAAAGALAVLAALVSGARALDFSLPPSSALLAACRSLLPHAGAEALVMLPLVALGVAVLALGGRSYARQVSASRRFLASLEVVERVRRSGCAVTVFRCETPQAFCAGFLRPQIYLSTGACAVPAPQLDAVVGHERHHRARRDPLRIALARAVADGLFFVPVLRRLTERYAALAEIAADEAASRVHGRPALASALLTFGEARTPATVVGVAPERVDHLLGRPARWELPLALLGLSLLSVGGVVTAALAAPLLTGGVSLNVPLLLAQSCMLVMLSVPVVLAASGAFLARGRDARPA